MYSLEQLTLDREIWKDLEFIPIKCSLCQTEFETKYGTLYNVIRRKASGIYCSRKCAGAARAVLTQKKYELAGGKKCKRCDEFKPLEHFSPLLNPPYFRAECRRCHNYKPARQYSSAKEKAIRNGFIFTLSLDQYIFKVSQPCFYCQEKSKNTRLEFLEKSKGYIDSNVIPCCQDCQKFKNDLDHQSFIDLCQKIISNYREVEK